MAGEWLPAKLGDYIEVKHGFAFDGEYFSDEDNRKVLLTPGNFEIGGGFKDNKLKYYNGLIPEDYILKGGDIIVTMTDLSKQSDTLGYPARVPQKNDYIFLHNQRLGKIIVKSEEINRSYLYYLLRSNEYREEILASASGTSIKHTAPKRIESFKFLMPPKSEQIEIAAVLDCLENKIELNRRMNDTLEGIAQALFKSWFVDFDAVKAKAEGREPEGMDDATASLFPSAFTESTLGPIPEGWEISSLGDFIEMAYGKALKANGRNEGFVPVYGSNGQIGWHDTALVKGPSIVVGRKGNPGTIIYVHEDFFPIDTTFFVIPSQRVPSIIFLQMLMERLGLPSLSADSAVPGLNRNAAYSARCILPPLNLIENFNKLITPFILKKENLKNEDKRLIDIRDLLLPRLISGKLRVGEISETVEAMAL